MRVAWIPLGIAVMASVVGFTSALSSCSDSGPRPNPAAPDPSGDGGGSSGNNGEGGTDAPTDAPPVPATCMNTIRDGAETDVDCGGNVCPKCIDGFKCVNDSDCAGGACLDNICSTAACSDGQRNNDESDSDCGGKICARCTIGKRCTQNDDCQSQTCTNEACACPKGMAIVAKSTGGAYCVDETEVTKGSYNKFITANVPVGDQDEPCKTANTTFIPRGAWPPSTVPNPPGIAGSMGLPVHYVDWCDAYAYCKWAKKQLCGRINGGPVPKDAGASPGEDAWYNACSAQGTRSWPYSNTYDPNRCKGFEYDGGGDFGDVTNEDDGLYQVVNADATGNYSTIKAQACQGGSVGLYQMSGNVAEWEDNCDGNLANSQCAVRGGSYNALADEMTCDALRTEERMPANGAALKDIGFRCCLY